jgi:hypothetical protein
MEEGALAPDQKKAVAEGRTVVFVDQSGFYLLPGVGGITPALALPCKMRADQAQATVRALQGDGLATQAFYRSYQTKGAAVCQPTGSMLYHSWATVKDTRGLACMGMHGHEKRDTRILRGRRKGTHRLPHPQEKA